MLDSGFQRPGFRIPQAKNFWIPESGFPYMGRERDKTGDVGKFHDTYILVIHISKFMITRDHMLYISNPFSLQRPFGSLLFDIFLFNMYHGKQGLDTFDDGYVDGIYLLRLKQDVCSKKVQTFVNIHWICI